MAISKKQICSFLESSMSDEGTAARNYAFAIKILKRVKPEYANEVEKIREQEKTHLETIRKVHKRLCK